MPWGSKLIRRASRKKLTEKGRSVLDTPQDHIDELKKLGGTKKELRELQGLLDKAVKSRSHIDQETITKFLNNLSKALRLQAAAITVAGGSGGAGFLGFLKTFWRSKITRFRFTGYLTEWTKVIQSSTSRSIKGLYNGIRNPVRLESSILRKQQLSSTRKMRETNIDIDEYYDVFEDVDEKLSPNTQQSRLSSSWLTWGVFQPTAHDGTVGDITIYTSKGHFDVNNIPIDVWEDMVGARGAFGTWMSPAGAGSYLHRYLKLHGRTL